MLETNMFLLKIMASSLAILLWIEQDVEAKLNNEYQIIRSEIKPKEHDMNNYLKGQKRLHPIYIFVHLYQQFLTSIRGQ